MFAALNGAHNQTLVSAALKGSIAAIRAPRLVMRAKAARIPHVICHAGPPTRFRVA